MLKELYDYALENDLILPAGFIKKQVHAYVLLAKDGKFLGIMPGQEEKVPCPDIGSMVKREDKCNVLAGKRSILFPSEDTPKAAYFRETMAEAAKAEPRLALCLNALKDADIAYAVSTQLDQMKLNGDKVISFMVDGQSILELETVKNWWLQFRRQFSSGGRKVPCLITGQLTVPLATMPPISGLSVVGGLRGGSVLICFDKEAFESYGLKQGANAPVSEEAFAGVKAALDDLLTNAPVLAGMKFVHWYDKPVAAKDDKCEALFGSTIPDEEEDDEDDEADTPPEDNPLQARRQADALIGSAKTGAPVHELPSRYYILLLSGVSGRVMVRAYEEGNYRQLTENLRQWEDDLRLTNSSGTAELKPAKLAARLARLVSRQKSDKNKKKRKSDKDKTQQNPDENGTQQDPDKNIFERMAKELSGLTPAVLNAILNNAQFPDAVVHRALAYLRSQMFESEDEEQTRKTPDSLACQWLKAWLCRREREKYQEEVLSVEYNERHPEPAYHCGALVAVYGAIQHYAMPDVNASLIDRYYASASQTPALVLGQLSRMSNYHIGKLEGLRMYFSNLRDQVACAIGGTIPAVLLPEQQAYFALGYYQMCAKLEKERLARKAAAEEKKTAEKENKS